MSLPLSKLGIYPKCTLDKSKGIGGIEMITIACKGKLIAVLQDLGYSKKRAQELIKLLE